MQLTNQNGDLSFGGLIDAVQNIEDATSMSLFQYTKRATILSRVYIEQQLANEEILPPLMLNTLNLYTGLIMTAMDMNRQISGTKKVRDAMSVVATESWELPAIMAEEKMHEFFLGSVQKDKVSPHAVMAITKTDGSSIFEPGDANNPTSYNASSGGSVVETETRNPNLPSGRVIQINFGPTGSRAGDAPTGTFTVDLYLQLLPRYIPTEVAHQFVDMNFTPSFKQRWMQCRAGELSFIQDLVLGNDRRKKRRKAMKNDKTGALKDMIERQENSLANSWLKLALVTPERQNIANTILIFEKKSFDKACSAAGLRFRDYNSRQKFFNKTFSMMLCTIDPMYNKIEMFYHGLNAVSEFTFDQVKRNSKTDSVDLMTIMKTYAQGMAPKY